MLDVMFGEDTKAHVGCLHTGLTDGALDASWKSWGFALVGPLTMHSLEPSPSEGCGVVVQSI
jgi:hypothetical protein